MPSKWNLALPHPFLHSRWHACESTCASHSETCDMCAFCRAAKAAMSYSHLYSIGIIGRLPDAASWNFVAAGPSSLHMRRQQYTFGHTAVELSISCAFMPQAALFELRSCPVEPSSRYYRYLLLANGATCQQSAAQTSPLRCMGQLLRCSDVDEGKTEAIMVLASQLYLASWLRRRHDASPRWSG